MLFKSRANDLILTVTPFSSVKEAKNNGQETNNGNLESKKNYSSQTGN